MSDDPVYPPPKVGAASELDGTTSEQFFRKSFWTGTVDPRPLALFRLVLGGLVLFDLIDRARDFRAFFTDDGVLPRAALVNGFVRLYRFSLFDMWGDPFLCGLLYTAGVVCAVLFVAGYRTRLFNILTWVFVVSLHERNIVILDGGDTVVRCMLFWMMFADCGQIYSVDAWLGRVRPRAVPVTPLRVAQIQVILIYICAAASKTGPWWRDGTALYHSLQLSDWARASTAGWVIDHPRIAVLLSRATIPAEAAFLPLTMFPLSLTGRHRRTKELLRLAGIAAVVGLHAGIFITMRVGLFSLLMPACMILFIYPSWIPAALDRWLRPPPRHVAADPAPSRLRRLARNVLYGLALTEVACCAWMQMEIPNFAPRTHQTVNSQIEFLGLWQNWKMFAPNPLGEDGHWQAMGHLGNKRTVNVLADTIPEFLPEHNFFFRRWAKFRSELYANSYPGEMPEFAKWLCCNYPSQGGNTRLHDYDLVYWQQPSHNIGEAPRPIVKQERWHHRCFDQPGDVPDATEKHAVEHPPLSSNSPEDQAAAALRARRLRRLASPMPSPMHSVMEMR